MKIRFLALTTTLFCNVFAITDEKVSPEFSFLDAAGIQASYTGSVSPVACDYRVSNNGRVTVSWSVDIKNVDASLAIYSLSGQVVQIFPIKQAAGSVVWDASAEKIARGIYFAKLSFGASAKNIKIVLH